MQRVFLKMNPFFILILFMLVSIDTALQKVGGGAVPPGPPVSTPLYLQVRCSFSNTPKNLMYITLSMRFLPILNAVLSGVESAEE